MFWFLGTKFNRKHEVSENIESKPKAIFKPKLKLYFEYDLMLNLERHIIKNYCLSFVFLIRAVTYIFYTLIIIFFFFVFLIYKFDISWLLLSFLFLCCYLIIRVLISIVNIFYFVVTVILRLYFLFVSLEWNLIFIFCFCVLKNFFFFIFNLFLNLSLNFFIYCYFFFKFIIYQIFFKILVNIIWLIENLVYLFFFIWFFGYIYIFNTIIILFFFLFSILVFFYNFLLFILFFFKSREEKSWKFFYFINLKHNIKLSRMLFDVKGWIITFGFFIYTLFFQKFIIVNKVYIFKFLLISLINFFFKYLIIVLVYVNFLLKSAFFWKNPTFFEDRLYYVKWNDIRELDDWGVVEELKLFGESKVKYSYTKYFADRHYFGLNSYAIWQIYIWKHKYFIPFSYYLHYFEWWLDVKEIEVLYLPVLFEIERSLMLFKRYIHYYFIHEKNYKHISNLIFDLFTYINFFLFQDLFLYYFQFNLFLNYLLQSFLKFFNIVFFVKINPVIQWLKVFIVFKFLKFFSNFIKYLKKKLIVSFFFYLWKYIINFLWYIYFKLKKLVRKLWRVGKFIFITKKEFNVFQKIFLFFGFYSFNIYCFFKYHLGFKLKFNKNTKNVYYYSNKNNLITYFFNKNQRIYTMDYVFLKNYKKDERYLFYQRMFLLKNIDKIIEYNLELQDLYDLLATFLSYFDDLKSVDELNWYDHLTGGDFAYKRVYQMYKNYLFKKSLIRKQKIRKFRNAKVNYFYYLICAEKKKNLKKIKKNIDKN